MASRSRSFRARNKTTTIGTSALIALGGLGCGRSTSPSPAAVSGSTIVDTFASAPVPPEKPKVPKEDDAVVAQRFAPYVVTLPNIAQKTLYTWTKTDQIEALFKDSTLLTRSESPEFGTSYFEQVLEERAKKKNDLAKLLRSTAFAKQRYAWPNPFATRVGIGNESYGDELIRIELKPEAWFVIMKMSSSELTVVDMNNKPVPTSEALAHPERLAAAYFVQDKPVTGYRASMAGPNERIGYREYVLFNESMIASYSVGTPEIAAELEKETLALEKLLDYLKTHDASVDYWQKWMVDVTTIRWTSAPNPQSPIETYDASLAFADFIYHPDESGLNKLVENLRNLKLRNQPYTHIPTITFPTQSTTTPATTPNVVPKKKWKNGTF